MIACKSCGHRNEDGDGFCGSCGAYLGWSDASVEQAVATGRQAAEATPVATLSPPATVDLTSLESELDAHRQAEDERARAAAAEQQQREAAAAQAKAEAEAKARTEELAMTRAQQAAEVEARTKAEAEAQMARAAQAKAEAEAQARAREAAEARAESERQAKALAEAQQGTAAEAEAKQREQAEALARADAARLAAQEAQARAEAKVAEEARARQDAELAAQTAIRQKEEVEAQAAASARAVADAEAAKVAAEAAAARAVEEARQADAAKRAAALVAQLPPAAAVAPPPPPVPQTAPTIPPPPGTPTVGVATGAEPPPPSAGAPPPGAVLPGVPAPMEQKPGAPVRQRVDKSTPQERKPLHHGDLICGQCGEGNLPARKFCRKCGASLVDARVNKVSWWKRLFTREPRHIDAGVRPQRDPTQRTLPGRIKHRLGRMFGTGKRVAVWILALAIAIVLISPYRNTVKKDFSTNYTKARQFIAPHYEPVHAVSATAPFGTDTGSNPDLAIDGLLNTHWASAPHPPAFGQQIVVIVQFQGAETIRKIGFDSGDQDTPQAYATEPRPRDIHLVYDHADGTKTSGHDLTLNDVQTFQSYSIDAKNVTAIEIHIDSLYSSLSGNSTSLAEVEFFKLQ